jgi:hypothetical protein
MKIEKVSMQKEKAKKYCREYCKLLKTREKDYIREIKELKACYYQLSKGRPIINIVDVFKSAGVNEVGYPRLAFSPAKLRKIYFHQSTWDSKYGSGSFRDSPPRSWFYKIILSLPEGTFPRKNIPQDIDLEAPTPVIPPKFLPRSLRNCYILWEVESWEKAKPKRDPILLKKISGNLYAIMCGWHLTKLEELIMRGR